MGGELKSLYCNICALAWPHDEEYGRCPQCDEPTQVDPRRVAMSVDAAESLISHIRFEQYCETQHVEDVTPLSDADLLEMGIEPALQG